MMKLLSRVSPAHRALFWQLFRYGVTGLFVTACQATIYWFLAAIANLHPQLANTIGFSVAVLIGYVSHNAFTFRGQEKQGGHAARTARFAIVSLVSYALNALWVYLCVTYKGWPEWSPIPAMLFVTPAIVFVLNRRWVFR